MAKAGTVYFDVELDTSKLARQVRSVGQSINRELSGGRTLGVNLDVDRRGLAGASRGVDRLGASIGRTNIAGKKLDLTFRRISVGTAALAFGPLIQGLSASAAGATAMVGSLGPLTGGLAALPSLASAAAQALGTVKLASSGIGDALKAAKTQATGGGAAETAALERQRAAVEAVRSAKVSLSGAQRQATLAQRDLTVARAEARRELEDMRQAAERSHLTEARAVLSLKQARQDLAKAEWDPKVGPTELSDLRLRVREANQDLEDTRIQTRRERKDYEGARKKGVSGMPAVVSARQALADSNRNVAEASHQVAVAQRGMTAAMVKQSTAASAYQQAMAKLSPAAQHFVKVLLSYKPVLRSLQATAARGLFPGVERGIAAAARNTGVLRKILGDTGSELGRMAERFGTFLGRADVGRDLATQGQRNTMTIRRFGQASLYLTDALRHVTLAAGPLVDWITKLTVRWARSTAESAKAGRESGRTAAYFERTRAITERLISITRRLGSGLAAVFRAGRADGDSLWRSVDRLAGRFDRWANSLRGQQALAQWFRNGRLTIEAAGRAVARLADRFHQLRSQGQSTGQALSSVIAEGLTRALAKAAENLAHHAPAIAAGFVRGFLGADVWGRLLVGGWLLAKFGGLGAFAAAGRRGGVAMGGGVAGGVRSVAPAIAAAAALLIGPEIAKKIKQAGAPGNLPSGLPKAPNLGQLAARGVDAATHPFASFKKSLGGFKTLVESGPTAAIKKMNREFGLMDDRTRKWSVNADAAFRRFRAAGDGAGMQRITDQARRMGQQLGGPVGRQMIAWANSMKPPSRAMARVQTEIGTLRGAVHTNVGAMSRHIDSNFRFIERTMGSNTREGRNAVAKNFRAMASSVTANINAGQITTKEGIRAMARDLRRYSGDGNRGVRRNFKAIAEEIQKQVNSGAISTKRGMEVILGLLNQGLEEAGIKGGRIRTKELNKITRKLQARGGIVEQRAKGGLVQFGSPGARGRDTIPATMGETRVAVGSGEVGAVFNRHQLPVLNARLSDMGGLPGFFKQHTRKHYMARGGIAEGRIPAAAGLAGVNPGAASVAKWAMRKYGASVSSGRRSGGGGSHHDRGNAADLTSGNMKAMGLGIYRAFGRKLEELIHTPMGFSVDGGRRVAPYAQADHFNHVHEAVLGGALKGGGDISSIPRVLVRGAEGPLKSLVQGSLDRVRRGANKKLEAALAEAGGGDTDIPGFKGKWTEVMARIAKSKRWNLGDWKTLVQKESGGNPNARNPSSGAYGLGQFLGGTLRKYAKHGATSKNPSEQIHAMAKYIADRYGNPSKALAFHGSHNWYAKGGLLGMGAGGLSQQLSSTLNLAGRAQTRKTKNLPKKRRAAIDKLLSRIKGIGLSDNIQGKLDSSTRNAGIFGEFADRASQLSVEGGDGTKAVQGLVHGKGEGHWLSQQLGQLFQLRNTLADAYQQVLEKRANIANLIVQARAKHALMVRRITDSKGIKKRLEGRLKGLKKRKAPKKVQNAVRKQIKGLDGPTKRRVRVRDLIKSRILPALRETDSGLGTKRDELMQSLEGVQGVGAPMGRLKALPPLGQMGGEIFGVQMRLRELGQKATTTDTSTADTERTEGLKQLLRESNQRFGVSQAQYKVFQQAPPYGGIFHSGGVVPGPRGAERTIVAKAGETVIPEGMGASDVQVNITGDLKGLERFIDIRVEQATRRQARSGARVLPGRGGG